MNRSIVCGLLGLISVVTLGALPVACQSGGVGDPCVPEDEYNPDFAGFKMTEENIESRSFQCATRICLVNHFQGRVSCPLGQPALDAPGSPRKKCTGLPNDTSCGEGSSCVEATTFVRNCVDQSDCDAIPGLTCDTKLRLCTCEEGGTVAPPDPYVCREKFLKTYACHKKDNCQSAKPDGLNAEQYKTFVAENKDKDCCVPGTDEPVAASVCGQCNPDSDRTAQQAVYCSCRCGPAGDPNAPLTEADADFNFCTCPSGFTCSEIRPNPGLGDPNITGKYCIKNETEFTGDLLTCKGVNGYWDSTCNGTPTAN